MNMDSIDLDSKLGVLTLLNIKGVGPAVAEKLIGEAKSVEELHKSIRGIAGVSSRVKELVSNNEEVLEAIYKAQKVVDDCKDEGIEVVSIFDSKYPKLLKMIPNKPLVLYLKGRLKTGIKNIACVGTREATEFGEKVADSLAGYFAEKGWSIVSGLAIGIDSVSHEGALRVGGHTVAILANGLDQVYPKKNAGLAEKILANGGALLSEYPPGTKAFPQNLVMRDRLQSGLSCATFVVQTGIKGGTMHTVEFSLMQGRRIFCPVARGVHRDHEKYEGVKILLEKDVEYFLTAIKRKPDLVKKIAIERMKQKVAHPIGSRNDYTHIEKILMEEESLLSKEINEFSNSHSQQLKLI